MSILLAINYISFIILPDIFLAELIKSTHPTDVLYGTIAANFGDKNHRTCNLR